MAELDHLFEGVVDEDEADERGEAFLCESCEILNQEAGICRDQQQTENTRPQADPQPELQVVEAIVSEKEWGSDKLSPYNKPSRHIQYMITQTWIKWRLSLFLKVCKW